MLRLCLLAGATLAGATSPAEATPPAAAAFPAGPYKVTLSHAKVASMDPSNQYIDVLTPVGAAGQTFPLVAYAHGFADNGEGDYKRLGPAIAAWGYVVAFANSCRFGCLKNCKTLPHDPSCFGTYYEEQLKVIAWAQSGAEGAAGLPINHTAQVGVAGHSMGGQSTAFSASYKNASQHNIGAAVLHHGFTHSYPAMTVPFLVFTGTADLIAPAYMAENLFNAKGANAARGIINKVGAGHHEPTSDYNPALALYTAAFFKLWLEGTTTAGGVDFEDLVYGKSSTSLCGGGDGKMKECEVIR